MSLAEDMNVVRGKPGRTTKVDRYKWIVTDDPGVFTQLDKAVLQIHPDYQRSANAKKILQIASEWSWVSCGAIIVGERAGDYWVIDGQHRVLAARKRSDIEKLPCLVFKTSGVVQEARGFLAVNTGRGAVSAFDRFKALVTSGDDSAIAVEALFSQLKVNMTPGGAMKPMDFASIGWALSKAGSNRTAFETVMTLAAEICKDVAPLHEKLVAGLHYIHFAHKEGGLNGKSLRNRIIAVGPGRLLEGASRAAAYYTKGGAKIWAQGMMDEINKGLHTKFDIKIVL
jgi:hypothetical protein